MKRLSGIYPLCFLLILIFSNPAYAKTLILDGDLESRIKMSQQISFGCPAGGKDTNF